jgi:hypothetical protein
MADIKDIKRVWREITVDTDSEVWDREEPLEGEFLKVEHDVGPKASNMYSIKTKDGVVKVWGSKVLDDKLLGLPQGCYVKLEYTGKVKGKSGNEYHSFKVFIDDATSVQDDDSIEPSDIHFNN